MFTCKRRYVLSASAIFVVVTASICWALLRDPAPVTVLVGVSRKYQRGMPTPVTLKQYGEGRLMLMSYFVEEASEQGWRQISSGTFKSQTALARNQDYTFSVNPPAKPGAWRLRVQYGLGTRGIQLWRERARVVARTGRIRDALRFEEWEMCESVSEAVE